MSDMTLSQMIAKLIDLEIEYGDTPVMLEVGGDGAIHQSVDINIELDSGSRRAGLDHVVLTSEA